MPRRPSPPPETTEPTTRVLDEQAARIGARIRSLRRARGFTLQQLAATTGLSHPFISQIERGHARPSMISLERIAHALGTKQFELLAAAESPSESRGVTDPHVVRAAEGARAPYPEGSARLLAHGDGGFEPLEFVGANSDPGDYYVHDEDEFLYVMTGNVRVDLAEHGHYELSPGDSLYYRAGTRHRWSAAIDGGYRLLLVKARAVTG